MSKRQRIMVRNPNQIKIVLPWCARRVVAEHKPLGLAQDRAKNLLDTFFAQHPKPKGVFPLFKSRTGVPIGEIKKLTPPILNN